MFSTKTVADINTYKDCLKSLGIKSIGARHFDFFVANRPVVSRHSWM